MQIFVFSSLYQNIAWDGSPYRGNHLLYSDKEISRNPIQRKDASPNKVSQQNYYKLSSRFLIFQQKHLCSSFVSSALFSYLCVIPRAGSKKGNLEKIKMNIPNFPTTGWAAWFHPGSIRKVWKRKKKIKEKKQFTYFLVFFLKSTPFLIHKSTPLVHDVGPYLFFLQHICSS